MSEDTRQRIIEAGAELIHQRGFNNTGLKDILQAAGVPKGSFYFYFPNKEAFGVEMLAYYGQNFRATVQATLENRHLPPLERLRAFFEAFHRYFESHGFTRGCPVGNLAQEMGDLSGAFREALKDSLDRMAGAIQAVLEQAQRTDDIPPDLDPRETAIFLVEAWHGAIIRMKVTKTGDPLEIFYRNIFDHLLK